MHDRERRIQALRDIDFLHGRLIHVGIFLDGFHEIGDARRAVVEFVRDAIHFEQRRKPRQLGPKRLASSFFKRLQIGIAEIRFGQERPELPRVLHPALFEPRLNRFLAIHAREFILILRRLERNANLLFFFSEHRAIGRSDRRSSNRLAQPRQTFAQNAGRSPRRRRRIVQLVSKPRRKLPQRRKLLALLIEFRVRSNTIGQHPDQTLRQLGQALKQFAKL